MRAGPRAAPHRGRRIRIHVGPEKGHVVPTTRRCSRPCSHPPRRPILGYGHGVRRAADTKLLASLPASASSIHCRFSAQTAAAVQHGAARAVTAAVAPAAAAERVAAVNKVELVAAGRRRQRKHSGHGGGGGRAGAGAPTCFFWASRYVWIACKDPPHTHTHSAHIHTLARSHARRHTDRRTHARTHARTQARARTHAHTARGMRRMPSLRSKQGPGNGMAVLNCF
jgi:hypothetical protein